jgi:hypothetical protein
MEEARKEYKREADDMAQEFGELHFIPLDLYNTIGDLLDALEEFTESDAPQMRIREQIMKTDANNHPHNIQSILNVAKSHLKLGEWKEIELLEEEVLRHC